MKSFLWRVNSNQRSCLKCTRIITTLKRCQQVRLVELIQSHAERVSLAISTQTSSSCNCQCHLSTSPLNNEFVLFEQALKQIRLEQEQEKSLTNNHLIQTLKRQHDELLSIYQQNKILKPTTTSITPNRIDREQQTIKLRSNDSQIQTDLSNPPAQQQQQKPTVVPTTNVSSVHTNGLLTATRIHNNLHNSHPTPSPSLHQTRPRLSANAVTSTATHQASTATRKTAAVANSSAVPVSVPAPVPDPAPAPLPALAPAPPPLPAAVSHDIVDLTEEDEDETSSRVPIQRAAPPVRQVNRSFSRVFLLHSPEYIWSNRIQHRFNLQHQHQRQRQRQQQRVLVCISRREVFSRHIDRSRNRESHDSSK